MLCTLSVGNWAKLTHKTSPLNRTGLRTSNHLAPLPSRPGCGPLWCRKAHLVKSLIFTIIDALHQRSPWMCKTGLLPCHSVASMCDSVASQLSILFHVLVCLIGTVLCKGISPRGQLSLRLSLEITYWRVVNILSAHPPGSNSSLSLYSAVLFSPDRNC